MKAMQTIVTEKEIYGFFGEYRFLSNMFPCAHGVFFENVLYPTSEHAYMSAKSLDEEYKKSILNCGEAKNAKKLGKMAVLRDDWESVKLTVMEQVVWSKFVNNQDLQKKLLETGNKALFEVNWWNDRFWGTDEQMKGDNHLGKILVKTRTEIRHSLS